MVSCMSSTRLNCKRDCHIQCPWSRHWWRPGDQSCRYCQRFGSASCKIQHHPTYMS
jgi:hypothetical protein